MRICGLRWWLMMLAASGCNCQPEMTPDAATPLTLSWPAGAKLEITATTESSADVRWGNLRSGDHRWTREFRAFNYS